jgi:ribosomal protein S18 acetylase RimI-like enzyme
MLMPAARAKTYVETNGAAALPLAWRISRLIACFEALSGKLEDMRNAQEQGEAVGVTLRPAGADDEGFLLALYASTRRDEMAAWGWKAAQMEIFLRMQFLALQQRYAAERDHSEHRIILREDVPVGRILIIRSADEIRLADIALLPEHRCTGIGSALIGDLQEEAARAGLPVRLHVTRDNRAARLYERLGFVVIGDTDSHFKMEWLPPAASTVRKS